MRSSSRLRELSQRVMGLHNQERDDASHVTGIVNTDQFWGTSKPLTAESFSDAVKAVYTTPAVKARYAATLAEYTRQREHELVAPGWYAAVAWLKDRETARAAAAAAEEEARLEWPWPAR